MKWGTFIDGNDTHIAPSDEGGWISEPHIFDEVCICEPTIEIGFNGGILIIHKAEN